MAFTTQRGASGVDFLGTEGIDSLFILNETGEIKAEALGGADVITVSDSDNVVGTTTIKGGEGDDTITFDSDLAGQSSRLIDSEVNGGAGDDDITLVGAVSSKIRGNEDRDDFFLTGDYTFTTINGNSGEDTFTLEGAVTLSNTKILGGTGNDGAITLVGEDIIAVDSTVNGSKGVDNITVGDIVRASGFTIYGGQGDDVITLQDDDTDGIVLSGDLGDDVIDGGDADDIINGGEGSDVLTAGDGDDTIDGGAGDDNVRSQNGDDVVTLGEGDDTYDDGNGDDTITGGAGADTFGGGLGTDVYVYDALSDSAATVSGIVAGFDSFDEADLDAGRFDAIDITAVASGLGGNTLVDGAEVDAADVLVSTANTFAELKTELADALTASGQGADHQIAAHIVTVAGDDDADIDGKYIILNNSNTSLDAGDMMFAIDNLLEGDDAIAAADNLDAFVAALNAGFAL